MSTCPLNQQEPPPDSSGQCIRCGLSVGSGQGWYWCSGRVGEHAQTAPEASTAGAGAPGGDDITRDEDDTWGDDITRGDDAPGVLMRFPGYALVNLIGSGGGGQVYEARSTTTGARVALKVIADAASPRMRMRFQREIAAMAAVEAPGLIDVLDVGYTADGAPWFAMPLVDGPSLADVITSRGALPVDEAVRIVEAIARTLSTVHRSGLIHRDIKPGNILLRTDGTPILSDLGLVLQVDAPQDAPRLTRTHLALGTPRYMSPEQRLAQVDDWQRVDTYALGLVLYECLGGQLASPASGESLTALPDVPEALILIARRATSPHPADRYGSAALLADDLRAWQSSRWGLALRLQGQQWLRRRRTWLILGVQLVAVIAAVAAATMLQSSYTERIRQEEATKSWRYTLKQQAIASPARAAELFDAFVKKPAHQGTVALGEAWLWRADQAASLTEEKNTLGRAIQATDDPALRQRAVSALVALYQETNDWEALSVLVDSIRRDPDFAPGVTVSDRLIADSHLTFGDIEGALPHLSPEDAAILTPLAKMRTLPDDVRGPAQHTFAVDLDGDGREEPTAKPHNTVAFKRTLLTITSDGSTHRLQQQTADGPVDLATLPQSVNHLATANGRQFAALVWNGALHEIVDGTSREVYPHSHQRGAFLSMLEGADLNGDGTEELLVGVGPSSGMMLEALDVSGEQARQLDRLRMGYIADADVLDTPRGPRLVAALSPDYPSPSLLGADSPAGGPGRVALVGMQGDALVVEQELVLTTEETWCSSVYYIEAAELDGVPPKEVVIGHQLKRPERCQSAFSILRQTDTGLARVATLSTTEATEKSGLQLSGVLSGHGPRDRLVVARHPREDALLLGEGDEDLPKTARPTASATNGPGWLEQLGLHEAAAEKWERIASGTPDQATQALTRAGEAWASAGRSDLASQLIARAARTTTPPDPTLLQQAAEHAMFSEDFALARALTEEMPSPDPALLAELDSLQSPLVLRFDAPLHPAWQVRVPEATELNIAAGELTVRSFHSLGTILEMPLRRVGDAVAIWIDGELQRTERTASLEIKLHTTAPEGTLTAGVLLHTVSNTEQLLWNMNTHCGFTVDAQLTGATPLSLFESVGGRRPKCRTVLGEHHRELSGVATPLSDAPFRLSIGAWQRGSEGEARIALREIRLAGLEPIVEPFTPAEPTAESLQAWSRLAPDRLEDWPEDVVADAQTRAMLHSAWNHRTDPETFAWLETLPALEDQPDDVRAVLLLAHAEAVWNRGDVDAAVVALSEARAAAAGERWRIRAGIEVLQAEVTFRTGDASAMAEAMAAVRALAPDPDVGDALLRARPALRPLVSDADPPTGR